MDMPFPRPIQIIRNKKIKKMIFGTDIPLQLEKKPLWVKQSMMELTYKNTIFTL